MTIHETMEETSLSRTIYFVHPYAIALMSDSSELEVIFDLEKMSWQDNGQNQAITEEYCNAWMIKHMRELTDPIKQLPEDEQNIMMDIIAPKLTNQRNGQEMNFKSEGGHLEIWVRTTQKVSWDFSKRFLAYDRLRGCRDLIQTKGLRGLPFVRWEVMQAVQVRHLFPNEIEMVMKGLDQEIMIKTKIHYEPLSDEEAERIRGYLSTYNLQG